MELFKLSVNISESIAWVTINNPPQNTLTGRILESLHQCFEELAVNNTVKVIILQGNEKVFSTGADISEMGKCKSAEQAAAMTRIGQNAFMAIEKSPKPVIAAIRGFCLGGGLEMALSCHMRFASDKSIFGMPEIEVGMIPAFGGSYRLPALIGFGKALEMILTGIKINSTDAKLWSLVDEVFPEEMLKEKVLAVAKRITRMSSASLRMALRSVNAARQSGLAITMDIESISVGELYDMHDLREGVLSKIEKRKPDFIDP